MLGGAKGALGGDVMLRHRRRGQGTLRRGGLEWDVPHLGGWISCL